MVQVIIYLKKVIGLLVLVAFTFSSDGFGQSKTVTKGNRQWVHYYNQTKVAEKWAIQLDGGYRWENDFLEASQYLVRIAGGYKIASGLTLAAGFGYWGSYTNSKITVDEWRPHQELRYKRASSKLGISSRIRLEQRFIEANDNNDRQFSRFNWRFRYYIGISVPVKQFAGTQDRALRFLIGDELFINAGKEIVYNIFDQNRLLIGPEFQLNRNLAFSLIYQGRFSALNLPSQYTYYHILWFAIRHKLDLTKALGSAP